jgi:hypothetical protein
MSCRSGACHDSGAIRRNCPVPPRAAVKFDEIVSALAIDLRYGDPAMLSQDDKDILLDEAEQTIELWEEEIPTKLMPRWGTSPK